MPITGKVAQILDASQLVLNVGAEHGVTPGLRFVVYEEGNEVKDPETGQTLGSLELVKGVVEALHVQDRITLAVTPKTDRPVPASVLSARLAETTRADSSEERRTELYVNRSQIVGSPKRKPIQVGDLVRSVEGPREAGSPSNPAPT